jgi:hypothetical protein
MRVGRRCFGIIAAALAFGAAPRVGAQSVALQGLAAYSTHSLLGNLLGGEAVFRIPLDRDLLSLQVGVAHLAGSSDRFESTCHGFIQQQNCEPEPVGGNAHLTHGSLELGVRLAGGPQAALRLLGGFRLAQVHASWRGQSTGRTFSGDRTWWGGDIGLEGTLTPWRGLPVGLQLSGGVTRWAPFQLYHVADAYLPLDVASTLATARVGLVWRPGQ